MKILQCIEYGTPDRHDDNGFDWRIVQFGLHFEQCFAPCQQIACVWVS